MSLLKDLSYYCIMDSQKFARLLTLATVAAAAAGLGKIGRMGLL